MSEIRRQEEPESEQQISDQLEPVLETENQPQVEMSVWAKGELNNLSIRLSTESDFQKKISLKLTAREKGVTPEQLFTEINQYKINRIRDIEKGSIRHFHRTSIDSFEIIAEMGRLVSRSKLKKERPDMKISAWSSSDNVMMTRDKFDSKGNLFSPGFSDNEVVGASGADVTLVFREDVMDSDNYDSIGATQPFQICH